MDRTYGYAPRFYGDKHSMRCTIKRKSVINDLRKYSKKYNSFDWKLHRSIQHGSKRIKNAFLRGFFDGDGSFTKASANCYRIRFFSVNIKELRKVQTILTSLSMKNKLYGPYFGNRSKTGYYELTLNTKAATHFIKTIKPTKIDFECRNN